MPWIGTKDGKGSSVDALVHGQGTPTQNMIESIEASYAAGVTDEFIEPLIGVDLKNNQPLVKLPKVMW